MTVLPFGRDYDDAGDWCDQDGVHRDRHGDVDLPPEPLDSAWPVEDPWNGRSVVVDEFGVLRDHEEQGRRERETPRSVTVRLADVAEERIGWLWPGRLPLGKLVTLDGDPSVGKSTVAVDIAAHVSTGRPWPDGAECQRGDVVILSAEDGLADTIRPRLAAAAGEAARVHALTAIRTVNEKGKATTRPPTLADVEAIRNVVEQTGARLLVVDVLMAYLPGKVDSHRDQDVRAVLHRIAELADAAGCTVLLLRHLNKSAGGSPLYRGGGSIGIIGAARAGFIAALDPDDDTGETRVLACVKSNLAAMPDSLSYRLKPAPGRDVARVVWEGTSGHAAAALLHIADGEERTERDEAVEWLTGYLRDQGGAVPAAEVMKAARADGISERTLKRARQRAGITSRRSGFPARAMWSYDPPVGPQSGLSGQQPGPGPTGPTGGPTGDSSFDEATPAQPATHSRWRGSGEPIDDAARERWLAIVQGYNR
jgi:hypothetical protein